MYFGETRDRVEELADGPGDAGSVESTSIRGGVDEEGSTAIGVAWSWLLSR